MDVTDPLLGETEQDEVFEINDFTVVTEFERFSAQLESIIHDWGLSGVEPKKIEPNEQIYAKLKRKVHTVAFKGNEFTFIYHYLPDNEIPEVVEADPAAATAEEPTYLPIALRSEFSANSGFRNPTSMLLPPSGVYSQFGICEHFLLEPTNGTFEVKDENLLREILSVFQMTALSAECQIPFFLRFGPEERYMYDGVCMNRNVRSRFECFELRNYFKKSGYFGGLVDMFKQHVECGLTQLPPINASIQFDYVYDFPQADDDSLNDEIPSTSMELEFGDEKESIRQIRLSVLWPRLTDETAIETEQFSDLDPYQSPRWFLATRFNSASKLLYDAVDEVLDRRETYEAESRVLSYVRNDPREPEAAAAFAVLTQTHTENYINFVNTTTASEETVFKPEPARLSTPATANASPYVTECLGIIGGSKTAPLDSLATRIAVALTKSLRSGGSALEKFCYLWFGFVERLSDAWDSAENLPGFAAATTPILHHCLLQQKLEMLQFCIETKRRRHLSMDKAASSNDLFFDADDGEGTQPERESAQPQAESPQQLMDTSEPVEASGRLHATDMFLLDRPTEPLYIPITQDRGPMTEDAIEQRTQALAAKSADDRLREQLDVLLSDMQSFKAANPGAQIADFIRWHSPRDWLIDEETGEGRLSERMSQPDNIWLDTWESARAAPVSQQQRLFNEAREANAILHQFRELTVRQLIDLISPPLFHSVAHQLLAKAASIAAPLSDPAVVPNGPLLSQRLTDFCRKMVAAAEHGYSEDYFDLHKMIGPIEGEITRFGALSAMFQKEMIAGGYDPKTEGSQIPQICADLIRSNASQSVRLVDSPNGAVSMCIREILNRAAMEELVADHFLGEDENRRRAKRRRELETTGELQLPTPHRKHYLLRWMVPRPGAASRPQPQRMYAVVGSEQLHCSMMTTDDVAFH